MHGRVAVGVAAALALVVCVSGCSAKPSSPVGEAPTVALAPTAAPPDTLADGSNTPRPGAGRSRDSLLPENGNGGYDVGHYAIAIAYTPTTEALSGTDTITARATQALSRFDLDLRALTVRSVTVAGSPATFTHAGDKLVITPPRPIANGATFTTTIRYGGVPKPYDDSAFGVQGFLPQPDGVLIQGQPRVAAAWFPVNDTLTDKASYDITITAPTALAAVSNGALASKRVNGPDTTWHWVEPAPMASYLAIVAIGKYRVTMTTHNGLPVVLAVADPLPRTVDAELAKTPTILDFLVMQFGPYPFTSLGGIVYTQTNLDALENQTRPSYPSDGFDSSSDTDELMAHELAHQWFGDSVTVRDWSDIWLNEGFATYAEWLWSEHIGGRTPKQHLDRLYNSSDRFPQDPPGKPTLNSLFDDSVYDRGAATLEALRIAVGDATFWRIVRGWAHLHAGGDATTAEFIAYADKVSGHALDAFLRTWLYAPGKPPYPNPLG
jgi:aminopeptidase N